jgi:glycosyltransferase involved in cell wall biosynthesis
VKVLYISNALTHYYNLVLSRLNSQKDVELIAVVPSGRSAHVGDGVYQTRAGINFPVIELEEAPFLRAYSTFTGLAEIIRREKPDAVIVGQSHLQPFLLDPLVRRAMKSVRAALLLKSIPFRVPFYDEVVRQASDPERSFGSLPSAVNHFLLATRAAVLLRRVIASIHRRALALPDAHVTYVEAADLWRSYGVEAERVFVTRNSPDTDLLLGVRDELLRRPSLLPANPHRLLHVGRLVEWKRVDMLLRAFSRVRRRFPDAELVIIGNGPQEQSLQQLAVGLGLGDSVIFTGGVYDPFELGSYYLASALYVLAGMGGLSINEAMCFARPILCSVCDGTERILVREGENGRYFRDGDEDDLVEKITWFFDNPERLAEFGRKSEEIIRSEVNIGTVIEGYLTALRFATARAKGRARAA